MFKTHKEMIDECIERKYHEYKNWDEAKKLIKEYFKLSDEHASGLLLDVRQKTYRT